MVDEDNELEGVPEPGDVIVGKYRVDRVLGTGGMGCVVAATHTTLEQTVAIKFLLAKAARNPKNVVRFQREAQAAAKIRSDHVAKVSDIGTLESGAPYMVMEFLEGEDLADRLQRGPLGLHDSVTYLLEACEALAEAHQAGIVHRDLKPANLFLARLPDGSARIKVLDFGISKIVAGTGSGADLTKTSALMGSPLYMSPEQMMSAKAADHRADIWALGCILFETLSGQPPFIGDTLPEICSHILTSPPSPLGQLAPATPPGLVAIVEHCLAKEPQERFQDLGELAIALAPFGGEAAIASAKTVRRVMGLPQLDDGAYLPVAPTPYGAPAGPATTSSAVGAVSAGIYPTTDPSGAYYPPAAPGGSGPYPAATPMTAAGSVSTGAGYAAAPQQAMASGTIAGGQAVGRGGAHTGASTAAPLAQTMGGEPPPKSRTPLVLVLGGAMVVAVAVGLAVGLRGAASSAPSDSSASANSGAPIAESTAAAPSTTAGPSASNEASASTPASASASAEVAATTHGTQPAVGATTTVRRPRHHPPRRRQPVRVKKGDDAFSTLRP